MRQFILGSVLAILIAACGSLAPIASPPAVPWAAGRVAVPADIQRAGVITVGFPRNPNLVSGVDAGRPLGVAPDLVDELAARMGVKIAWVDMVGTSTAATSAARNVQTGTWDIVLASPDQEGYDGLAWVGYLEIDHTLLVPSGSTIKKFADADKPGVRIWVSRGAPVERMLSRSVTLATVVLKDFTTQGALLESLFAGGWEGYAQNRNSVLQLAQMLPGTRVLDDRFGSTLQSFGIRKDRPDLLAYLKDFAADPVTSGLIRSSIGTYKIPGVQPAR